MGTKSTKQNKRKLLKIVDAVIVGLFIILAINLITTKSDKFFEIIGYRTYTVLSGSMEPKFYPGDVVVIKHKDKTDIKVNDIVTYRDSEGVIITHRIIEETPEGYITKGDNNNVEDGEILTKDNIIGEFKFSIPKIGFLMSFLSKPLVIAGGMVILAVAIFISSKDE